MNRYADKPGQSHHNIPDITTLHSQLESNGWAGDIDPDLGILQNCRRCGSPDLTKELWSRGLDAICIIYCGKCGKLWVL